MDTDHEYALLLSQEINCDVLGTSNNEQKRYQSINDTVWELMDPAPNIYDLFMQFNNEYFGGLLASVEVKWSSKMTLCAGLCSYEGQGGLCCIKLSEPLLKLRPRSDLVNTLLHEMIHAVLFVTENNKDRDGHGPEFQKHMNRINKVSGSKITVNNYRQHWWKCNGPCVKRPPYFGILRRAMNRAPSIRDPWFKEHMQKCGGTFVKIKEPQPKVKKMKKQNAHGICTSSKANNLKRKACNKPITSWLLKEDSEHSDTRLDRHISQRDLNSNKEIDNCNSIYYSRAATCMKTNVVTCVDTNASTEYSSRKEHNMHLVKEKFLRKVEKDIFSTKKTETCRRDSEENQEKKNGPLEEVCISTTSDEYMKLCRPFRVNTPASCRNPMEQGSFDNYVAKEANLIECPACPAKIPETLLNIHLDTCLS